MTLAYVCKNLNKLMSSGSFSSPTPSEYSDGDYQVKLPKNNSENSPSYPCVKSFIEKNEVDFYSDMYTASKK